MKNKQLQVWDVTFFTDSKKRHLCDRIQVWASSREEARREAGRPGMMKNVSPAKTVYLSLLKKGEKK